MLHGPPQAAKREAVTAAKHDRGWRKSAFRLQTTISGD